MTEPLGIDAQAISRRAHALWLKRGCPTGTPDLDWAAAERELRAEAASVVGLGGGSWSAGAAASADICTAPAAGGGAETLQATQAPSQAVAIDGSGSELRQTEQPRTTITTSRVVTPGESSPRVPRPRAPRSIVTRTAHAPAARLLVALVPEASRELAVAGLERTSRRR